MLLAVVVAAQPGCHHEASPQLQFDQIRLMYLQGSLKPARTKAEAALKRFSGRDQDWAWKFRLLLAEILGNQGLSPEVLSLLGTELPQTLAGSDSGVRLHMLRALAYSHLGRSPEADQDLQLAEQACALSQCRLDAEIDRIAGAIASERNDPAKAETFFRKSLESARRQGDRFLEASDLLNLGVVAIGKEHFDESVDLSNGASSLAQSVGAGLTEEKALGNLGWAYYKMGDFDKSLDFFQAASKKSHELGAVIDEVEWLNDEGLVYFQTDRYDAAEPYYRQSLALAQSSQNQSQIIEALTALSFLSAATGKLDQARQLSEEARRLAQNSGDRPDELYALLVQGQIFERSKQPDRAEDLFRQVSLDPKSDTSLRWEAHNEIARLYEAQHKNGEAEKEFRKSLDIIELARGSLRHEEFRLPFLANAVHLYDDYIRFLIGEGNPDQALELADYSRAQTLLEGLNSGLSKKNQMPGIEPRRVARRLGATILFYWLGENESYLWAVQGERITLFHLPPRAEIEARILKYRKALTGPLDPLDNSDGRALYDLLVGPAAKLIPRNTRVVVIPDGALNNLNFETLPASQPSPHYWIEDATISDANSISMLAAAAEPSVRTGKKLLLIGDALAADPLYPELRNAAAEIENIQSHFPVTSRLVETRQQATPAAYFESRPERFSYIHFVAHGTASQLSPLDSAIVLSKSGTSFKLYARDITAHPLRANLVTISSCYGEGTHAYTGEGLVGLSWAFLRAGAHNVIGALWEVSDNSTPQLMDRFYGALKEGRDPATALREAKLGLLHSSGPFRKPFYWAPFQLYSGF